jgi:hypothetical protein
MLTIHPSEILLIDSCLQIILRRATRSQDTKEAVAAIRRILNKPAAVPGKAASFPLAQRAAS